MSSKLSVLGCPPGKLGLIVKNDDAGHPGLIIIEVAEGSSLLGKVFPGDRLMEINGKPMHRLCDLTGAAYVDFPNTVSILDRSVENPNLVANYYVSVPKGKLGLRLDAQHSVLEVLPWSPLLGQVEPWDQLVSVDDMEVSMLTSEKVIALLSTSTKRNLGFRRRQDTVVQDGDGVEVMKARSIEKKETGNGKLEINSSKSNKKKDETTSPSKKGKSKETKTQSSKGEEAARTPKTPTKPTPPKRQLSNLFGMGRKAGSKRQRVEKSPSPSPKQISTPKESQEKAKPKSLLKVKSEPTDKDDKKTGEEPKQKPELKPKSKSLQDKEEEKKNETMQVNTGSASPADEIPSTKKSIRKKSGVEEGQSLLLGEKEQQPQEQKQQQQLPAGPNAETFEPYKLPSPASHYAKATTSIPQSFPAALSALQPFPQGTVFFPGQRLQIKQAILSAYDLHLSAKKLESLLPETRNVKVALESLQALVDIQKRTMSAILAFSSENLTPFESGLQHLVHFKIDHGHLNVLQTKTRDPALVEFVQNWKSVYKQYQTKENKKAVGASSIITTPNTEEEENIQVLEYFGLFGENNGAAEGTVFNETETKQDYTQWMTEWDSAFEKLKNFVDNEGHCEVPRCFKTKDGFALGLWVQQQRKHYAEWDRIDNDLLTASRVERLKQIGLSWAARINVHPNKSESGIFKNGHATSHDEASRPDQRPLRQKRKAEREIVRSDSNTSNEDFGTTPLKRTRQSNGESIMQVELKKSGKTKTANRQEKHNGIHSEAPSSGCIIS